MSNFKLSKRERERERERERPILLRVCMHAGVCVCMREKEYLSRRVFVFFFLVGLSVNGVKTDVQHKSLSHRDAVPPTRTCYCPLLQDLQTRKSWSCSEPPPAFDPDAPRLYGLFSHQNS